METTTRSTVLICGIILLIFVLSTIQRNSTWFTEELLWKDVVSKSPDKPRGHINLARFYSSIGSYQAAFREYQLGMKLASERKTPQDMEELLAAQSNLGQMFLKTNEAKLAEAALRATLTLNPTFGPAAVNLSNLLITQNKEAEAITILDRAIVGQSIGPSGGKLYQNKGIALCNLGYVEQSNLNFTKAVTLDADLEALECR